jgi:hypothetical protein
MFQTKRSSIVVRRGGSQGGFMIRWLAGAIALSVAATHALAAGTVEIGIGYLGHAWETRIFEDRQCVIKFVCEVPTAIDQRLFALGRTIQQEIE